MAEGPQALVELMVLLIQEAVAVVASIPLVPMPLVMADLESSLYVSQHHK